MKSACASATVIAAITHPQCKTTVRYNCVSFQITAISTNVMRHRTAVFRPIVVTNCTTRKRAVHPSVSVGMATERESLANLAKRWTIALSRAPKCYTAGALYVGRAMVEAKSVARTLAGDLFVVSAGLGLVSEQALVPNYDFSGSLDSGPLRSALEVSGEPITKWWSILTRLSGTDVSLHDLISANRGQLVLLALPATYLRMVATDLSTIDTTSSMDLRIFTSEAGQSVVPISLKHCVLPYDERLESLKGFDGTRADFPQRALRHFVEVLAGQTLSLDQAHAAVVAALVDLSFRTIPCRHRRTDAQIVEMIHHQWTTCAGSSTRLHRYLRDEALVACEQSRFRTLWRLVQTERHTRGAVSHAA